LLISSAGPYARFIGARATGCTVLGHQRRYSSPKSTNRSSVSGHAIPTRTNSPWPLLAKRFPSSPLPLGPAYSNSGLGDTVPFQVGAPAQVRHASIAVGTAGGRRGFPKPIRVRPNASAQTGESRRGLNTEDVALCQHLGLQRRPIAVASRNQYGDFEATQGVL
jgi:hypothetical protein